MPRCIGGALVVITVCFWANLSSLAADDDARMPTVDRYGDPLPRGAIARLGTVRWRHPTIKSDMVFSADGKELIVAGYDKTVRYYDLEGKPLRTLRIDVDRLVGFPPWSRSIAISPNGKLATALGFTNDEARRKATYWLKSVELPSGKELMSLSSETKFGDSITFLPDGRTGMISTEAGRLRFFELTGGAEVLDAKPLEANLQSTSVSADGAVLALASRAGDALDLHVWKWLEEEKPRKLAAGRCARGLAFSPDGAWLAASEFELGPADPSGTRQQITHDVRLYNLRTFKRDKDFKSPDTNTYFTSVGFSPDGKLLAAIDQNNHAVLVWNIASGKVAHDFGFARSSHLEHPAFSPDSRLLAIDPGDGLPLTVRNLETGEAIGGKYVGHSAGISQATFLPRGDIVVTSDWAGTVRAWDARSGRPRWESRHSAADKNHTVAVRGLAASPDGKLLATSSYDGTVRLWNAVGGEEVFRLRGHGELGVARLPMTFTPDSQRLVSAGDDLFLRIWDVRTGKAVAEHDLRPPELKVRKVGDGAIGGPGGPPPPLVSSDGRLFVSLAADKIRVFDAPSARLLRELPREIGNPRLQAISPDGKYLFTGEEGAAFKLPDGGWRREPDFLALTDLLSGKTVRVIPLKDQAPRFAAFSPDGKYFATAAWRLGPIRLWRTSTGDEVATIDGLDAQVTSLAFSADSKLLVSGFFDTTALVWDIESLSGKARPE